MNTRVNSHISLNGYWAWSDYHTNTNGLPSNQYNANVDYGRAAIPSNRFNLIGTTGTAVWLDSLLPRSWRIRRRRSISRWARTTTAMASSNDRPALAPAGTNCSACRTTIIKCTPFGNFNAPSGSGCNYRHRFQSTMRTQRPAAVGMRTFVSQPHMGMGRKA